MISSPLCNQKTPEGIWEDSEPRIDWGPSVSPFLFWDSKSLAGSQGSFP